MLTAQFIYSGLPDYWQGNGDRWDDNKGCLFAYYGHGTTVRDIVDDWVEDFNCGGDFEGFPENVTDDDVRAALLAMLTEEGRADYSSGAESEFAMDYTENMVCGECEGSLGFEHEADCEHEGEVTAEDCEDGYDSPFCIVLIECEVCPECGKPSDDDTVDDLCDECQRKDEEFGHDLG